MAGRKVMPTLLARVRAGRRAAARLVSAATSAKLREVMRLNVTHSAGTGRRAEAEGYRVGGKTGTAEMPGRGGYREKSVISSFAGAFPMDAPKYVVLVLLFEPQSGEGRGDRITAGAQRGPRDRPHRRAHRAAAGGAAPARGCAHAPAQPA